MVLIYQVTGGVTPNGCVSHGLVAGTEVGKAEVGLLVDVSEAVYDAGTITGVVKEVSRRGVEEIIGGQRRKCRGAKKGGEVAPV